MWTIIAIFFGRQQLKAEECSVSVSVTPTKTTYAVDDLLGVDIVIINQGNPEMLRIEYPRLQSAAGGVVLRFTPSNGLVRSPGLFSFGGLSTALQLSSRRSLTVRVYLERFLEGFQTAHYSIPWDISVPCEGRAEAVTAKGVLRFDISRDHNSGLEGEYAEFVSRARAGDRYDPERTSGPPQFSETRFRLQEAVEALRLARSPLVIPYLEELASLTNNSDFKTIAFASLGKFPNDGTAKSFVLQSLQSQNTQDITEALQVLKLWQIRLPEVEVRTLLIKNNQAVQVKVMDYLGSSSDPAYRELLEEYSKHSDPRVAAEARIAATRLSK